MNQHLISSPFINSSNLKANKKDHYHLNVLNSRFGVVPFQRHLFLNKPKNIIWRPSGIQFHPGHELQVASLLTVTASVLHFPLESRYFSSNSTDSHFGVLIKSKTDSFHASGLGWPFVITEINLQIYLIKIFQEKKHLFCLWTGAWAHAANITCMPVAICYALLGLHLLLVSKNSIHSCPEESNVQLAFLAQWQDSAQNKNFKTESTTEQKVLFIFLLKTVFCEILKVSGKIKNCKTLHSPLIMYFFLSCN